MDGNNRSMSGLFSPVAFLQRIEELECENAQLRDRIEVLTWEAT